MLIKYLLLLIFLDIILNAVFCISLFDLFIILIYELDNVDLLSVIIRCFIIHSVANP